MLNHWFKPVQDYHNEDFSSSITPSLRDQLLLHKTSDFPSLEKTKIAIIGSGNEADLLREYLYNYATIQSDFTICDLGNYLNRDVSFIIQSFKEIVDGAKILPIILGADATTKESIIKFLNQANALNHVWISNNCNGLQVYDDLNEKIGCIGFQAHLSNTETYNILSDLSINSMRLGQLRARFDEAEACLRDAHWVHFDPSVLKISESNYFPYSNASGMTTEECCQLMHYAGIGNNIKILSFESISDQYNNDRLRQLMAQVIWYFMDGIRKKVDDTPSDISQTTSFIVNPEKFERSLKFIKNNQTNRWWLEIAQDNDNNATRFLPCTYNDYLLACNNQIPDRIIKVMS